MAPPPTPASLMGLPASWLLKLATTESLARNDWGDEPAVPLFRTCAFFRDTVLQHRTAVAEFGVPIAAERFPAELARLCTVARRSSYVRLVFMGPYGQQDWAHAEPHITHVLVCAMAELGGPLTCVKEVHTKVSKRAWSPRHICTRCCGHLPGHAQAAHPTTSLLFGTCKIVCRVQGLQQTALVPAWLKVCCPDVKFLQLKSCMLTPHWPAPPTPPAAAAAASSSPHTHGQPSPLTCQHLGHVNMFWHDDDTDDDTDDNRDEWRQHIRQQLAALPGLTSLQTDNADWMLEPALSSSSLTWIDVLFGGNVQLVPHLEVQFPSLRQLESFFLTVDDAWLEALFRLPHLERLSVFGFSLQRSHAHRAWAVRHLGVYELGVASLARLPLDGVHSCVLLPGGHVMPSGDAQAVARVVDAVRRWGGLGEDAAQGGGCVSGKDTAALLTTLGPLLAALPVAQRSGAGISNMWRITPATLLALGQQLPPSITFVALWSCSLQPEAWPALLPSLPAAVAKLSLSFSHWQAPTEEQLVALCGAAVRHIQVSVRGVTVPADTLRRVEQRLAEMGAEQLVAFCTKQ